MTETTSKKIIRNTIFSSAGFFWSYLLSFLLTPFIIHRIGIEAFGIWAIANTAINFFIFLDPGFGSSYVKYIAEYNTKKDYKTVNNVINTGLVFSLLFCVVVLGVYLLLKDFIIGFLKFSPEHYEDILFTFFGILMVFIINYAFTVFKSTLAGLQRMDVINIIFVIVSIPSSIGIIMFLSLGYGLKGLVCNSIMVAIVTVISYAVYAYKIFPQMSIHPKFFSSEILRKLWGFGFKVQIAGFSEFINRQLDKILLGYLLNVRLVGFYELGSKMALTVGNLPAVFLQVIEPASSELDAAKDERALNVLYTRGTKYIVFLTLPLSVFVITNASLIMCFWMSGPGYEKSALAIQILTIGYSFFLINSVGRLMARGMGMPQHEMVSASIILGSNVILSVVLIMFFGYVGALIGTSTAAIIGSLFFLYNFHKHINIILYSFVRAVYYKPLFACIISILMSLMIDLLFFLFGFVPSGRIGSLIYLCLKGGMFSGVYFLCILAVGHLDEYDKGVFLSTINMFINKLRFVKKS